MVLGNFRSYSICFSSYSSEFSILYYTEMRTNIQVFWTFLGVSRIKLEKILSFWRTLDLILEVLVIIPVSFRSCNSETRTDVHGFWSIQGFFYEIGENIVVLGNFRSYSICFYVLVLIPGSLDLIPLN